jgi:hypothetical protein
MHHHQVVSHAIPNEGQIQGGDTTRACPQRPLRANHSGDSKRVTPSERRFFLLLNDTTTYMLISLLITKGDVASTIKIKATTELEVGRPLRVLHTNNDNKFATMEFIAYCTDEGIQSHFSAPYTLAE